MALTLLFTRVSLLITPWIMKTLSGIVTLTIRPVDHQAKRSQVALVFVESLYGGTFSGRCERLTDFPAAERLLLCTCTTSDNEPSQG